MAEQLLKLTVNEVNDLLSSDYNMISFDSLSRDELLQIFFDCLHKMNTYPKVTSTYFTFCRVIYDWSVFCLLGGCTKQRR